MFNQVILIERLIKDAEVREIANGKLVANATLVTNKKFKNKDGKIEEKSEFHNLVVWNGASAFSTYTQKGSLVFIRGELTTRSWEKNGAKQYRTEVVVNEFKFLDKKQEQPADKEIKIIEKEQPENQKNPINMVLDEFFNINPTLNYGNNTQRKNVDIEQMKKVFSDSTSFNQEEPIEINNIPF